MEGMPERLAIRAPDPLLREQTPPAGLMCTPGKGRFPGSSTGPDTVKGVAQAPTFPVNNRTDLLDG